MVTKKIKATIPESVTQKAILAYLKSKGYMAVKVPLGPMMVHAGPKMHMAPNPLKGFPDIMTFSIHDTGRMIGIEVKSAIGKLNPQQIEWRDRLLALGVLHCVARSIEDVKQFLNEEDII